MHHRRHKANIALSVALLREDAMSAKCLLPALLAACVVLATGVPAKAPAQQADAPGGGASPVFMTALANLYEAAAVIGYIYASPLFEMSLAQHRQVSGLDEIVAGPLGVFSHFKDGLSTDRTRWFGVAQPRCALFFCLAVAQRWTDGSSTSRRWTNIGTACRSKICL